MKNIYDSRLIQIDITNACINKCAHCTRAVRHFKTPHFVDLLFIEKALQSIEGWTGAVGCMGGEPTLHPQFPEICKLYRKYFPKNKCAIFTCGGPKYKQHKKLIRETFGFIHYNEHKVPFSHQPIFVASEEVVPDEKLRNELIDNCWLQNTWCPAITIKGAFFCEVAATLDLLFDGPGGYPLEKGRWKKGVKDFQDQRDRYCKMCSVSIPMPIQDFPATLEYEYVSEKNAERLKGTPLEITNKLKIMKGPFTREQIEKYKEENKNKNPEKFNASIWGKDKSFRFKIPISYHIKNILNSRFNIRFKHMPPK